MAQKLAEARNENSHLKVELRKMEKTLVKKNDMLERERNKYMTELEHQTRLQEQFMRNQIDIHQKPMIDLKLITDDLKSELERTKIELDAALSKLRY